MRAVGTGKHPEGRFPEGQVCDLPAALDGSGDVHPDYKSFIDDGYLALLAPEDDPGRTRTQIANSIVRGDALNHPVDAALADEISPEQALAITHTGDPGADPKLADPHEVRGTQTGIRGVQLSQAPKGHQPGSDQENTGNAGGAGTAGRDVVRGGGAGDRGTAAEAAASTGGSTSGSGTGTGPGEGAAATLPGGDEAKQGDAAAKGASGQGKQAGGGGRKS